MMRPLIATLLALPATLLLGGCDRDEEVIVPAAQAPEAVVVEKGLVERRAEPEEVVQVDVIGLRLESPVAAACDLAGNKTFFSFDSSKVSDEGHALLTSLSECMEQGGLQGRSITVVGHTDARGTEAYNKDLGKSRAKAVKAQLTALGVDDDRIALHSQGETGAATNDMPMAWDRQVTLRLGEIREDADQDED